MQLFASIKNNIAATLSPNETASNMEENFKVACSETEFSKEAMINPPETTMFCVALKRPPLFFERGL